MRLVTSSYPTPEAVQPVEPYGPAQQGDALESNRAAARGLGLADVLPRLERRGADGRVLSDRLYVATSRWGTTGPLPVDDIESAERSDTPSAEMTELSVTTELHAFDTSSPVRTAYTGSGSVDGYVLGRWALSSYDGYLRVATTSAPPWGGGEPTPSSVIVMEEREKGLVQVGRVDGLGVGERIYAVSSLGVVAGDPVTFARTGSVDFGR